MNILDPRRLIWLAFAAAPLWACGDDSDPGDGGAGAGKGGGAGVAGGTNNGGKQTASGGEGGEPSIIIDGGEGGVPGPGPEPTAGVGGDPGSEGGFGGSGGNPEPETAGAGGEPGVPGPVYPQFPSVLSVTGCTGVGPLCSVTQVEGEITANCGVRRFTGEVEEDGDFTLVGDNVTAANGTVTATTCAGQVRASGVTATTCSNTVTPSGGTPSTTQCTLAVDPLIAPGISCLALPKKFDNLVFAPKAPLTGASITLGAGDVIQDGCNFQATFPNNVVITGTASKTGISFTRSLAALADAQTPNATEQNPSPVPAFLKDAVVNHSCTAAINGTSVTGECTAGNVGGGANAKPATSLYTLASPASGLPGSCSAIGPFTEELFVLDSCTILKNGEGNVPGIGEPICAFQQNGCSWQVSCGPNLVFGGVLEPGQTKATWQLQTGTPCEASFDASGKLVGSCTVPGQAACNLSSKSPAPAVGCPQLPTTNFFSHGCGNDTDGRPLDCRLTLQHGCDFAAICDFNATRFPDYVFAGKTSTENGIDYMKFPGLSGRQCTVQRATAAELEDEAQCRAPGEWYGDCLTPAGQGCANTFQCVASEEGAYPSPFSNIRRGLRIWFE